MVNKENVVPIIDLFDKQLTEIESDYNIRIRNTGNGDDYPLINKYPIYKGRIR